MGADHHEIVAQVTALLASRGWTLTREPIPGQTNGITRLDGSNVVIVDSDLAPAQAAKTALHEAGHVLMHASASTTLNIDHRGVIETEAESVAYIVAGSMGLDTAPYSIGYITGWAEGDVDLVRTTASRVLVAARTIVDELEIKPVAA